MKKRIFMLLCVCTMLLCALPVTAGANSLPRPYMQITIEQPSQPIGQIVLLSTSEPDEPPSDVPETLTAALPEGWYVWGGVSDPEQEHRASFYGTDMPETFRIALVLADGTVTITNEITRTRSMQGFTVHADEGTITTVPTAVGLLLQFLCTCSITLLIEGVLLRLFRFSFRENWKVFLAVNLATQILMTLTFGRELIDGNNYVAYLLVFLIELAIFVIEAVAYAYLLHGQTRTHRVVYALWANAASFVCGIWLAVPVFNAIMEMM